ncbi:MAG TPA: MFS transporter [Stellaceae bacterium]|nr:MFS transporter [Stellaceae bacterium]
MNTTRRFDVSEFLDRSAVGTHRFLIFCLCTLVMVVDGYDVFVVGYVVPALAKSFGVAPQAITSVFVLQTIALGIGAYAVAPFADWIGRRKLVLICTAIFGIVTLLCTRASSIGELSAYRFLASLFFGAVVPNLVAIASEYGAQRSRASLVMILFIGYTVGAGGGGYLAAVVVGSYGWQGAFWMGGLVPLALVVVVYFWLPESIKFLVLRGDRNAEVAAQLRRIDPQADLSATSAGFTIREEKSGSIPVVALFRQGRAVATLALWLSDAMNLFVLTFIAAWAPTFLRLFSGAAVQQAAGVAALFSLGGIISPLILGGFMSRYSASRALAVNYVLGALAVVVMGYVAGSLALSAVGIFFAGWFIIGGQGGINALAAMLYPTEMRATGVGWALGAGRIGSVFGPALGGFMLENHWSATPIYFVAASPLAVAAIATVCVRFAAYVSPTEIAAQSEAPIGSN